MELIIANNYITFSMFNTLKLRNLGKCCYYFYFTNEDSEAHKVYVICPKSHSK